MNLNKNILIIEDEVLIAMNLQMELLGRGYSNCKIISTGEEALLVINVSEPDLIIVDINLSGKYTGIETVKIIYEKYKIPIIFMSGYNIEDIKKKSQLFNPIGYLEKPIKIDELVMLIETT